jgi:DNA-binding NtrC family response regulator
MRAVQRAIRKASQTDATILVLGESGTGKELVARAIHYQSRRSTEPFVAVNCAAIPESLVESELFGYVQGAFTGATHARAGFFQTAGKGTIFLDEVGEMGLAVQAKLLRVLERQEIRMVGSDRTVRADARIVAATNQDIAALVRANRFRADLYFRLNVLSVELPPLRERGADLSLLLEHFQRKWGPEAGGHALRFSERALRALQGYDWPGNVRELENLVHRLAVMVDGGFVDVPDLPGPMRFAPPRPGADLRPLAEVEREHVAGVLRALGGNVSRAARVLGIDRKTLRKKLGDEPER